MHEYTPEQTSDFQTRAKNFTEEYEKLYKELLKKFEVEFIYLPVTIPSKSGGYELSVNMQIGDLKYKAPISPLNDEMKSAKPVIEN